MQVEVAIWSGDRSSSQHTGHIPHLFPTNSEPHPLGQVPLAPPDSQETQLLRIKPRSYQLVSRDSDPGRSQQRKVLKVDRVLSPQGRLAKRRRIYHVFTCVDSEQQATLSLGHGTPGAVASFPFVGWSDGHHVPSVASFVLFPQLSRLSRPLHPAHSTFPDLPRMSHFQVSILTPLPTQTCSPL